MEAITIGNLFQNGIEESEFLTKYRRNINSAYRLVGFDIHTKPGLLTVNQALVKDSPTGGGTAIDGVVTKILPVSNGVTYIFTDTEKVFSRDSGGNYTVEATFSPVVGDKNVLDAYEYNGAVYYAFENILGKWDIGGSWASRNDNFAVFTNGNEDYHPMMDVSGDLYIGDGNLVAVVDDTGTFTPNGLDVMEQYKIKTLRKDGSDLLIGTYTTNGVSKANIFRWDTWSVSFSVEDTVEDTAINAFIPSDNYIMASVGDKGQLYVSNGAVLDKYKKIPGDYDLSNTVTVFPNAVTFYNDLPMFGLSMLSGSASLLGVYSLGSRRPGGNKVLNLEYVISTGYTSGVQITALAVVNGIMLVGWKDTNGGITTGVDRIDINTKFAGAYFETGILSLMANFDNFKKFIVNYDELPDGTGIRIAYDLMRGDGFQLIQSPELITDTERQQVYGDFGIASRRLRVKVLATTSGNAAPEIEDLIILTV